MTILRKSRISIKYCNLSHKFRYRYKNENNQLFKVKKKINLLRMEPISVLKNSFPFSICHFILLQFHYDFFFLNKFVHYVDYESHFAFDFNLAQNSKSNLFLESCFKNSIDKISSLSLQTACTVVHVSSLAISRSII